jgi:pimeloyl-ACP methyl ester carboxylesterase
MNYPAASCGEYDPKRFKFNGTIMKLEIISRYPSRAKQATPLLFVHGAWHGAWCWDVHFLEYFAKNGFAAHAVSLRGHGKSEGREKLRWTRISDFVDDLKQTVQQLPSPPVVIAHSMGGYVIQKYLEIHSLPAVVLMASVPPNGVLATTLRIAMRHPLIFAKINLTLSLFPLVSNARLASEAFFSENLPDKEVRLYSKQLQNESYLGFLDMLAFNLPKPQKIKTKPPILVLGAANDLIFKSNEIEATARAYNTQAEIFPNMAHDMMLDQKWQDAAERILFWLKEQKFSKPSNELPRSKPGYRNLKTGESQAQQAAGNMTPKDSKKSSNPKSKPKL